MISESFISREQGEPDQTSLKKKKKKKKKYNKQLSIDPHEWGELLFNQSAIAGKPPKPYNYLGNFVLYQYTYFIVF